MKFMKFVKLTNPSIAILTINDPQTIEELRISHTNRRRSQPKGQPGKSGASEWCAPLPADSRKERRSEESASKAPGGLPTTALLRIELAHAYAVDRRRDRVTRPRKQSPNTHALEL